jgi:hypothetical protein
MDLEISKPIIGRRFTWLHVTLAHRGRSIATGVSVMARGMGRPSRRPGTRLYCTSWCTGVPGQRPGTVYTRVVDRDRLSASPISLLIRPSGSWWGSYPLDIHYVSDENTPAKIDMLQILPPPS